MTRCKAPSPEVPRLWGLSLCSAPGAPHQPISTIFRTGRNTYGQTGSSAIAKASVPIAVNELPTLTRLSAACRRGSVTLKICTIPPDGSTSEIV